MVTVMTESKEHTLINQQANHTLGNNMKLNLIN